VDLERDLAVRKPPQARLTERNAEAVRCLLGQLWMGAARKDFQVAKPCRQEPITAQRSSHRSVHIRLRTRAQAPRQPAQTCGGRNEAHQRRRAGWGGRIRTSEYGIQSPPPYRLATPHHVTSSPGHRGFSRTQRANLL